VIPVSRPFLSWKAGNFHWLASVEINVQIVGYRDGVLSTIAFHRRMGDFYGAATPFAPPSGSYLGEDLIFAQ
jgi:hypothetical protein